MGRKERAARAPEPPKRKASSPVAAIAVSVILILIFVAVLTIQPSNTPVTTPQPPPTNPQPGAYEFVKQGEVRFLTAKQGFITTIDVELAQEDSKRQLGLMYRDKMGQSQGMLFVFEDEEPRSFWMKNTVLPLDMIFVNGRNEIVTIHKNATPYSEQSYASTRPAKYVVEVNAGFSDGHKISVGDRIAWSRF